MGKYTLFFDAFDLRDIKRVGGKNSSLGEMICNLKRKGIDVPPGFATTSEAYFDFLDHNRLKLFIADKIASWEKGNARLEDVGKAIRKAILKGDFPPLLKKEIIQAYRKLGSPLAAVRSSSTSEDLPSASFAGQMQSFLGIKGEKKLLEACKKCLASLYTDRAIVYRREIGLDHVKAALSVGVQKMVRSDKGASGVMFTLDTETGFPDVVLINAIWGLGELIVGGAVDPDEYLVFKPLLNKKSLKPIIEKKVGEKLKKLAEKGRVKPCSLKEQKAFVLSDDEILQLSRWAALIEEHYKVPMDIEWAKDGESGKLYIVQARPETVESKKMKSSTIKTYSISQKGKLLLKGSSIGRGAVASRAIVLKSAKEIGKFKEGAILVTSITDPDWVPIMKMASGIITDHGGRTSHAAIVSRELGLPAIVGTESGTKVIKTKDEITLSCAEGETGFVYQGRAKITSKDVDLNGLKKTKVDLMINMADPLSALSWWKLPAQGIGLARMEFIITDHIQIHPMALCFWNKLIDKAAKEKIRKMTEGYPDKKEYFVDKLSQGIAKIAISKWPNPVIVRMSDFKTNEYAELIGGREFEPKEENPMLGWRGASRYYHPHYEPGFALECQAIKRARETMGLANIVVMIPFCRTLEEADLVLKTLEKHGLKRGRKGLKVYVMCEIPSNVILAEEFAKRFDGFSIGSNDLTQLLLGVDRDSTQIASLFDERNESVLWMLKEVIKKANKAKCKIGICGQAPSDYPEFAKFLVECGIDSISVSPDSFLIVHKTCKEAEEKR